MLLDCRHNNSKNFGIIRVESSHKTLEEISTAKSSVTIRLEVSHKTLVGSGLQF